MLPASNKLVAPTTEVKSDGTAALFIETNAQAGPVSQIKFLSVSSINTASFTSSAMQYSAYITGGDAELTLNFALSCMLLSGGVINIFLAGFEATGTNLRPPCIIHIYVKCFEFCSVFFSKSKHIRADSQSIHVHYCIVS